MDNSLTFIVLGLTQKLFEAEERRLDTTLSKLNQRNKRLYDIQVDGFLHEGQFYLPKDATLRSSRAVAKTALHMMLQPEMDSFLQDKKFVVDERGEIKQILHILLGPCRCYQEIRDALPECLVNCLTELSGLRRRDETAYTLQDKPRALRQFEKILPKIEFYSAAKLLY